MHIVCASWMCVKLELLLLCATVRLGLAVFVSLVVVMYCSQKSLWYLGVWNELIAVCLVYPDMAGRDTNDFQITVS